MKDRFILGISAYYHDSAAAILRNGEIIACAEEERFTRKKGDYSFPINAVNYCLDEAGIDADDLDHVVFYDKPVLKFDRIIASYIHSAPRGLASFLKAIPLWLKSKLWVEDIIRKELKYNKHILFTEHHQSHAASAFFPSPFEEAAIITVDGAGEWATTTIGLGSGNSIKLIKKIDFPHSLGLLYSAFTYYCGFKVNSGEYKLMGLAPYGTPRYLDLIKKEIISVEKDGSYILNEKYFNYISGLKMISRKFQKLFGMKALKPDEKPTQFYMDIAASIQALFNEIMVKIAVEARKTTGLSNLCMAGGVALNCVANERILKEAGFDNVWVQPAAGDAGGALGAALYVHYSYLNNERKADGINDFQKGSYLGPSYSDDEIESILNKFNASYRRVSKDELIKLVASEIASQKVVGWFQGRMEFGPRALGNRSILGDARSSDMQTVMNLKIKFRESFRPFAPSVLEEDKEEYFEMDRPSPYMLFTAQVKKDKLLNANTSGISGMDLLKVKRSVVPAITHVDNSARLQTVSKDTNPLYHSLLSEFKRLTGCPVIINTSFNVRGEPIVCSPEDAYLCFMGTNIDVLAIGSFILYKEEQPKNLELSKWKKTLIKD
ncbi:MAG: carbamoyltransferase [Clostridiaceae bacterium]|nr:carbamoyltransferase [Clostridiaceae bacterium]